MIEKHCLFNKNIICTDCGECYACDVTPNKKCNNCGKCLELEGYDTKAIRIDEIMNEGEGEIEEIVTQEEDTDKVDLSEDSPIWEFIDDIKELKDLVDDDKVINEAAHEEFPGLIIVTKDREKEKTDIDEFEAFNEWEQNN